MTTNDKIIKNKLGLLKLTQHLGNVSQACHVTGYSRDTFYPHSGKYCFGKTPWQTFEQSISLALKKQVDDIIRKRFSPSNNQLPKLNSNSKNDSRHIFIEILSQSHPNLYFP